MILVVGGGIGGLTLALSLHQAGIACRVFEAAPEIKPLGVGINLLPHAMREFTELGLQDKLAAVAIETREFCWYDRFGHFIHKEPRGRFAGYDWPQLSIHRGDLHKVLLDAVRDRLGADSVVLDKKCVGFAQTESGVRVDFSGGTSASGAAAIGCDGIHSAVRKQLHPAEGPPAYQGINMWRGVTRGQRYLTGASMVVAGWLEAGKMVVYPIRSFPDGTQLINWVAEIQSPRNVQQDWTLAGKLEDFYPVFADRKHEWLDIAAMIRNADSVLEYPMVDRDPLPWWTQGRVTLMGDAAHPMYPRGSNGGGQAILDARVLAGCLRRGKGVPAALKDYEAARLKPAYDVVIANRSIGPDAILRTVHERTGDQPFDRIEDVIGEGELRAMAENYKRIAGFERETLKARASLV
jgi:2-polyprenyl-6-methoxyphenol hydroxylase-like FAD-dependent oxidoreductase